MKIEENWKFLENVTILFELCAFDDTAQDMTTTVASACVERYIYKSSH